MVNYNGQGKELQKGWIEASIEDCLVSIRGISFPKDAKQLIYSDGLIACLRTSNIQKKIDWDDLWFVEKSYLKREEQIIQKGDILISISNSLHLLGKVAIVEKIPYISTLGTFIANLRVPKSLDNKYIFYYLTSRNFRDKVRESASTTTNISNISISKLEKIYLKLPPLPEQHRIVAKIEELFSELDAGIENLKTAQAQLKIYRQSVLKWAFEGKLTAKWREEKKRKGELKSADELLVQIKVEREKRYKDQLKEWEEAVKVWEAGDKSGKKPTKPQKPKEVEPLSKSELAELPELPEGWCWVKIGNLTTGVEYGTSAKSDKEGKVIVLRMGNIQNGIIDWSSLVYTSDDDEINQYLLNKDDVLFNRTNSAELVGKTAIYQGERPAIFAGYLIRVNQVRESTNSKYLNYFLNSPIAMNHANKVKTDGVNQSNINGEKLINYPFSYTSLEEQHQIVQEIETRLSICDSLEATITENLQRAEALRQSILKQAFAGKLVPQDPNDEPAEKLLERIKKEKSHLK